jgi:hypothetical protein
LLESNDYSPLSRAFDFVAFDDGSSSAESVAEYLLVDL